MTHVVEFPTQRKKMHLSAWDYDQDLWLNFAIGITDMEMGVLVQFFTSDTSETPVSGRFWGLVVPQDVITFWRATLILDKLESLFEEDLCHSYYAAQRNLHSSDRESADAVIDRIGNLAYQQIMNTPIPDSVIELIFKLHEENASISLWSITEEVGAGTLAWQQKFADIGVTHPDEVARRERAEKEVVARYEQLLSVYAREHGLPRECNGMWQIESGIVHAVEKGIEEKYGADIALGIAIVLSHGATTAFVSMIGFGPGDSDSAIELAVKKGIEDAISFLRYKFVHRLKWLPFWFVANKGKQEYRQILGKLIKEFEELPVTNPV